MALVIITCLGVSDIQRVKVNWVSEGLGVCCEVVGIDEMQFGFMARWGVTDAIFILH